MTAAVGLLPTAVSAQYVGQSTPPLTLTPRPGEVLTPANALARALRMLAQSPRDFAALITAGRAALDLGDTQAAIGFFGRAEEVRPSDPAPKIGMGAATVVSGDASGALRWFFEAQRLGASAVALGSDRGLAQDLLGNQGSAQIDYRAALAGREADEARRRLALSLGISGDRTGAFAALQPLVARRDPAVQRIRAFVLALVGDERGASGAIDQAMPGSGSRMAGFFRLLPSLSPPQKAAAVHLGIFPNPGEIRVASVSPTIQTVSQAGLGPPLASQVRRVARAAEPLPKPAFRKEPRIVVVDPTPRAATSAFRRPPPRQRRQPTVAQSVAPSTPPPTVRVTNETPQPDFTSASVTPTAVAIDSPVAVPIVTDASAVQRATSPAPAPPMVVPSTTETAPPGPDPSAPPIVAVSGDRLLGIDRLLAQADELPVPPAPRPQVEKRVKSASLDLPKAIKTADRKKDDEEREARASIGISGSNWVQLAGGSKKDRMGFEFRRLATKSAALKKRGGLVTDGKDYFRLLTGPFPTRDEAQDFVNQLAKDGVDGFSWTRTPSTLKIEKLPSK